MEVGGGKGGFEKYYIKFKQIFIKVCIFVCAISYFLLVMLPSNNEHRYRLVAKILNYSSETSEDYKVSQDWQEILEIGGSDDENMKTKHFVYSAYLDLVKNQTILRVIAVIPDYSKKQVYCHVFDGNIRWIDVLPATIVATSFSYVTYREAFILCNLRNATQAERIKFVSISPFSEANSTTTFSNLLKIAPPQTLDKEPHKFSLCVQPLFDYDRAFDFIQWMEFHKLMGVSHFTFYNVSIGPTVSCVMKSKAMNEGNTVDVLQWTVPIQNSSLLHINAQIPQITDCVFRYRGLSKYVVSVDVDEMIIPNHTYAQNYQQLIQVIDENLRKGRIVAQYQFRSAVLGLEKNSNFEMRQNNNEEIQLEDLTIYKYVQRQLDFYPYSIRSKYIAIPRNVIQELIHSMLEGVENAVELNVPTDFAFLHHYRLMGLGCPEPDTNCSNVLKTLDYSAHFFTTQLLVNVRRMMQKLEDECGYFNIRPQ